jgi:hypothetical protein
MKTVILNHQPRAEEGKKAAAVVKRKNKHNESLPFTGRAFFCL